jgi:CheY-like chemotaxis protein
MNRDSMNKLNCILIVEDSEMDTWLAIKVIELSGICGEIITARHGNEALEKLKNYYTQHQYYPEIMLIDFQMPYMDGIELIGKIRRLPSIQERKSKIILVTAGLDLEVDIPKIAENKVEHIFFKPLDKEMLLKILNS